MNSRSVKRILCLLLAISPVSHVVAETELAAPEEIGLRGNVARSTLTTNLGPIDLRWPRAVDALFGRTPERAVADAAQAVSRAIQSGSFPPSVQLLTRPWSIVFLDATTSVTGIPAALLSSCHPGWMTPPTNIYIAAERAANFCSGERVSAGVADGRLASVLMHEMGHAVEAAILGPRHFGADRMRAEGFASWFEQYASEFSSVVPRGQSRSTLHQLARVSYQQQPTGWRFNGSPYDYARASLIFEALVDRRGTAALMAVYRRMGSGEDLMTAIGNEYGWDPSKLDQEMIRIMQQ